MVELNPNILGEVLNKAAPELTDEEVDKLIAALRAERGQVLAAEAAGKNKPRSTLDAAAGKAAALALKFEDLDL